MKTTTSAGDPLEPWRRQLQETLKAINRLGTGAAFEAYRRQNEQIVKAFAQVTTGPAFEAYRRQNEQIFRSFAQITTGPAFEAHRQQNEQIVRSFRQMMTGPAFEAYRQPNEQIASILERLMQRVESEIDVDTVEADSDQTVELPETLPGEVAEVRQVTAAVEDALSVAESEVVSGQSDLGVTSRGYGEVIALLGALVWLSSWIGFWLHEAARTNAAPIAELSRFQLTTDLAFLAETTRQIHERIRRILGLENEEN